MLDVTGWRRYLPLMRGDLADAITTIEGLIMSAVSDFADRIDAATNEVAADIRAAKDAVLAAVAQLDTAGQTAVTDALAQLDGPVSRLEALGRDDVPADPTPVDPNGPVA